MKNTLIFLLILVLTACGQKGLNLLILHTDQQSQWTVGAYGLDDLRGPLTTPNLDALAADGILFTNFFTNSAVCSPSRALMMTGCYATRNGIYTNNEVMNDIPTLATQLNDAGYFTGYAGKWHLSGTAKPGWAPKSYGWTDNRFMFNRGHYKKITDGDRQTPKEYPYKEIGDEKSFTSDWLTGKAIDFIQEHQDEKFAYMVSYPDPHQPWEVREPFNSMYSLDDITVPVSYSQRLNPQSSWHQDMLDIHKGLNQKRLKKIKVMYSGSVNLLDYSAGRIIEELKKLNLYDKTIVIFTSDHGEYMGEHGILYKNSFYETAYRLPMIIRVPDGQKGSIIKRTFSMVDFMPGVLGLLGIEPNNQVHGRDFSTLLSEEPEQWLDEAQVHHSAHRGAGIFTPDYYLLLHKSGEHMLFDRVRDPRELYNLYEDPELTDIVEGLKARILLHHKTMGTPEWEWLSSID